MHTIGGSLSGFCEKGGEILKNKTVFFKRVAIGFGVWLPILGVIQIYLLIASWFDTPASELLRIPVVNRIFAHVPFLLFLQHALGVGLVLGLVLLLFFMTGTFVMTWLGKKLRYTLETYLLSLLPFYKFFRKVVALFAGENGDTPFLSRFEKSAFVHIYGNETFVTALVTAGSDVAVGVSTAYVPAVPNITAGRIYNTPVEWVHFTNIPAGDIVAAVAAWGVGTEKLVARYVAERIESGATETRCIFGAQCPLEQEVQKARSN